MVREAMVRWFVLVEDCPGANPRISRDLNPGIAGTRSLRVFADRTARQIHYQHDQYNSEKCLQVLLLGRELGISFKKIRRKWPHGKSAVCPN